MEKNNKIIILPDFIANQIAAGEVVQKPESVVKELVENSLDAGANEIAIVVKNAGKQLIHIVDNGSGLSKEDLELSVKRHATSKIKTTEDLEQIRTYGFRGEALASIASIANLEIRTRNKESEHGWKLTIEPMKSEVTEPCNMDFGTQVFVKNLFFNVPARRKFLKAEITEFRYISDTMIRFALTKPDVRFTFYDNDVLVFDVKPSNILDRIKDVLGKNIAGGLIPIDFENEILKLSGFIGEPLIAKQSKSGQYLFLNGRHIISKSLSHSVFSAFEHLLDKRNHPFYIINLELDPKNFDVNVHPQKHEVKFEDERYIYNIINKTVNEVLQSRNLAPELNLIGNIANSPFDIHHTGSDLNELVLVNKLTGEIIENKPDNLSGYQNNNEQSGFNFNRSNREPFIQGNSTSNFEKSAFDALFGKKEDNVNSNMESNYKEFEKPVQMYWQLHKKYIFTQTAKGIIVIDQHAAHERILYEKALRVMNRENNESQDLLFPVEINVNSSQKLLIEELSDDLNRLGFRFKKEDDNKIMLLGVPFDIISGNESSSFLEILEQFEEYDRVRENSRRDNLAASYGCRTAIKSGKYLTQDEMKKLTDDLFNTNMPYVCPHGRPIIIEFSLLEFDRRFGRT